jgi:hypothetical protein
MSEKLQTKAKSLNCHRSIDGLTARSGNRDSFVKASGKLAVA